MEQPLLNIQDSQNGNIFGEDFGSAMKWSREYQIANVKTLEDNSTATKIAKGLFAAIPVVGWGALGFKTTLVKRGHVGLSWDNDEPQLLAPGWHFLLSPFRKCSDQVPITLKHIRHGTINIVTVDKGFVGLAWDKGQPILLPEGMHQWDSETMYFEGLYDLSQPVQKIGPYTNLIVRDSTVAVTYNDGKLDI